MTLCSCEHHAPMHGESCRSRNETQILSNRNESLEECHYAGRIKDSIRRRGENISAWEIERVVEQLSFVEQAAAIGVPDELDDEEIKLFVKLTEAVQVESPIAAVHNWCLERLPDFQVPAYIVIIEEFPMTGTERIRKELLPTDTEGMEELSRK